MSQAKIYHKDEFTDGKNANSLFIKHPWIVEYGAHWEVFPTRSEAERHATRHPLPPHFDKDGEWIGYANPLPWAMRMPEFGGGIADVDDNEVNPTSLPNVALIVATANNEIKSREVAK